MDITILYDQEGMVADVPPHTLPPNGLSDARNVRFAYQGIERSGWEQPLNYGTVLTPRWALSVRTPGGYAWLVMEDERARALFDTTITEVTRANGLYTTNGRWSGGLIGGIPVVNNGLDVPQFWANPAPTALLDDLTNWPSTDRAYVLRPFYSVLVALGMRISGNEFPFRVRWSDIADPGSVPGSWDVADPTNNAGEVELASTPDLIVDGGQLRGFFVIYKENTTWLLLPTGSVGGSGLRSLFRIEKAFSEIGALSRNCFVEFGNKHLVLTDQDIIVHDGASPISIIDRRMRKWLFSRLDYNELERTHVVHATRPGYPDEIHVLFSGNGSLGGLSLIWNITENRFSIAEVGQWQHVARGFAPSLTPSTDTWDSDLGQWNADTSTWDVGNVTTGVRQQPALMAVRDGTLVQFDSNQPSEFAERISYIERQDFPYGSFTQNGQLVPENARYKLYRRLRPFIEAPVGTEFEVTVGGRDVLAPEVPIEWKPPQRFIVGRHERVDIHERRRFLSYRIGTSANVPWKISGMNIDFVQKGRW